MFEEFKNVFQKPNNGHAQLIVINIVVFLFLVVIYVFSFFGDLEKIFTIIHNQFLIPPKIGEFLTRPWTILTYGFTHDHTGIFHILFNMLGLYWFGKLFIEYLGSEKLIAVYVLGVLAGASIYLLMFNIIPKLDELSPSGMVGASGAVYAVMVATATLLPDNTFLVMFIGPVRIKFIALFFIVVSFIGTTSANAGGNIAHLGGALMGFVYIKQLQVGVNWGSWITVTMDWIRGLFVSQPKVKVTYRKTEPRQSQPTAKASKATQDEIDTILDKISDRGYESLTKEEKEKLFNASKK